MPSKLMPGAPTFDTDGLAIHDSKAMIGGTHLQSTKIDPAVACTQYTPLNNDSMPSGTPIKGSANGGGNGAPYCPGN